MTNRTSWYTGNGTYYIADIFAKNGKLVLICPLYQDNLPDITVHNHTKIDEIIRGPIEPIRILTYGYITDNIIVTIEGETRQFTVTDEIKPPKYKLTCTTLFLNDYQLIPLWYEWYRRLGVEHFYLYYNGPRLPSDIFIAPEITYIPWNFRYWNGDISRGSLEWMHHAQSLQMNHALWKYGVETDYMIFADLDEYMLPDANGCLIDEDSKDVIMFASYWSRTINGKIPKERVGQSVKMDTTADLSRNKCIYKTSGLLHVNIHGNHTGYNGTIRKMMHFYNWSKPDREIPLIV